MRSWFRVPALTVALSAASAGAVQGPVFTPLEPVWLVATDARGRTFTQLRGQVVVVTFASRRTADEARLIHAQLSQLVTPGEVAVVSVVTSTRCPLRARLRAAAHRRGVGRIAGHPLLDERGRPCRLFAVNGADILVIDRDGVLRRRLRGQAGFGAALAAVDHMVQAHQ